MNIQIDTHHSNQLLFLTARIFGKTSNGSDVCGTGFFYDLSTEAKADLGTMLLVTNKHVIDDMVSGEFAMHLHDGGSHPSGKSVLVLPSDFQKHWIMHPDPEVDLCAAPLRELLVDSGVDGEMLWNTCLSRVHIGTETDLALLPSVENVVMVGYPIGAWDDVNNLPLVRKGITSTHPGIDYQGRPVGLVDIASFPGSSGSPILVYNDGVVLSRSHPSTAARSRSMLLGVLFQQMIFPEDGTIQYRKVPTKIVPFPVTHLSAHLGVYCKAREILVLAKAAAIAIGRGAP